MEKYILPQLLILVPFLIGLGNLIKPYLAEDAKTNIFKKTLKTTQRIPFALWTVSFTVSVIYGFIYQSGYTGWKQAVYAVVIIGLLHGSVVAFTAMGLYDTAKASSRG